MLIFGNETSDLSVRYWGSTKVPKRLRPWREVFLAWHAAQHRYATQEGSDVGWWWGERPAIGLLSAAVWMAGGSTLEEYSTEKRPRSDLQGPNATEDSKYGRADLYAQLAGEDYSVEAKVGNFRLDTPGTAQTVARVLGEARKDAACATEGCELAALASFVARTKDCSWQATRQKVLDHRRADYSALAADFKHLFQVDLYPSWVGNKRKTIKSSDATRRYPGTTVFLGIGPNAA